MANKKLGSSRANRGICRRWRWRGIGGGRGKSGRRMNINEPTSHTYSKECEAGVSTLSN